MKNYFLLILSFIILSCTSDKNPEEVKDPYNLDIARELEICFDEKVPIPDDPEYFYPLCSDSNVRVFFLEPNYYAVYSQSPGWCGSCGCHIDLFKKEEDKYTQVSGWACCGVDIKQPVEDYFIIGDLEKKKYCWPSYKAKVTVRHDEFHIEEIIEYSHDMIVDKERHPESCEYEDSLWIVNKLFPSYSWEDSITYVNCEEIRSNTPKAFNFSIYEDTIIDLNTIDSRLPIKFKFNWLYEDEWPNVLGVISIDIIKGENEISNIDLRDILKVEAFMENNPKSKRFKEVVRDDIRMEDVNMDSYLDIKIRSDCGKACYYSYWIYNPENNDFEFSETYNYVRPYYIDCNNNVLYSYNGGEAWNMHFSAHKIKGKELESLKSLYIESHDKYTIKTYRAKDFLKVDTIK